MTAGDGNQIDDPELAEAVWDLSPLVDGEGDAGAERMLASALTRASAFAAAYGGRVADLSADELVAAVSELEQITDLARVVRSYGSMRFTANTSDEQAAALNGRTEAGKADVQARILFFELEWVAIGDEEAERLLAEAGDRLAFAAHHLRRLRATRTYLLSQPEERILAETAGPRLAAWVQLYLELTGSMAAEIGGRSVPLSEVSLELYEPDRKRRLIAMEAMGTSLEQGLNTRATIYNAVLGEKATSDRLRGYPTWLSSRNLSNELADASVAAQLEAVRGRYDIPRRWAQLKAKLLGLEQLSSSDLQAPVFPTASSLSYGDARRLVVSAYSDFSPVAGELVAAFFTEQRIDAPIRPGKLGGAFCDPVAPSQHAYVLTNFGSRMYGAMYLAHELGHGLHAELSRGQRGLQSESSLPLAEVASTFGEALVLDQLLATADDERLRLELLGGSLDDAVMNVFFSAACNRFEEIAHTARRDRGDLTPEAYTEAWLSAFTELWDDTIEIEPSYGRWWSYMPHMVIEPGYVYSYSFALLLSWSAFDRYKRLGPEFAESYLEMLSAGGSRPPEELVALIGLDLTDPAIWSRGLDLLDSRLQQAERLAAVFV